MPETDIDVTHRDRFVRKLWALTSPYFRSSEWPVAVGLLVVIIAMSLGLVFLNVLFNYWNNDFYNSLQNKDEPAFWHQMLKFVYIAVPYIVVAVYANYLQQMLQIRWRKWMTDRLLRHWLEKQNYYRLQLKAGIADNPEQRIEQDVNLFTSNTLDLALGLLNSIVTLFSFITILWTLSGPLSFTLSGHAITIPGYMVWVAIVYAALGSYLTFLIGRPLIRTNFMLQRSNATFRFGMTRVRENAESVAFYHGEEAERGEMMAQFDSVWGFWWNMMRQTKRLNWFVIFYAQLANVFPFLVASPRYFSGAIPLGGLMQIASAFGSVQGALSWFINNFWGTTESGLSAWKATADRLIGFADALDRVEAMESDIAVTPSNAPVLETSQMDLTLPDGRKLIAGLSAKVEAGDHLLITGPSGAGKTTLFRALAGLWPFGRGSIRVPEGRALFLPQRPYLPIGTLRHAIAYPGHSRDFAEQALGDALDDVNLAHLKTRLGETANWSMELSLGEQQRLAIARALLLKPDWLYLDEATAALDAANEQQMYKLLSTRLPDTAILSIAHRPEVARFHDRRLEIDPATTSAKLSAIAAE